jgi:hypothetical protein
MGADGASCAAVSQSDANRANRERALFSERSHLPRSISEIHTRTAGIADASWKRVMEFPATRMDARAEGAWETGYGERGR